MEHFTLGWLAVQLAIRDGHPERGAFYLGLTGLARLVPVLTFGVVGGISADRFDRRDVLMLTRVLSAAVAGVLAILTLSGRIDITTLLILTAISASAFAFDSPATISLGPLLVGPRHAMSAISLTRATIQAASLVGPLIAGVLIGPFGIGGVLMVIAVLGLLSRIVIGGLHPIPPLASAREVSAIRSMGDAVAFLRGQPTVRTFMVASVISAMMGASFAQLLPAVAHDTFAVGARELSWLAAALAVGTLAGALISTTMESWPRPGRLILAAGAVLGTLIVLFGMQRDYLPALLLSTFVGLFSMTYNGAIGNILQTKVLDHLRGRVLGLQMTLFQGGMHLGTLLLGTIGTFIGISNALIGAGVVIVATVLVLSQSANVRNVRVAARSGPTTEGAPQ